VKIAARRWKPVLASALRALQVDLGLPDERELEAVFDKLLLYEPGVTLPLGSCARRSHAKGDDAIGYCERSWARRRLCE
jgi:hypothetical protein